jgi:nitrite reductase/ring-hydroxylating ferredoxin subunit
MNPILPGAPWLIAHRSMLGVNKPYKITLNGQDYVLWQNEKGEVFALNNVCPHMQAPLSDGWICQGRDTITCPFHALEFDGKGRLCREGKPDVQPITTPLELAVVGDYIWTYGGFEPKLPIPDLIEKITEGFRFVGIAGNKSIQGDFLSNLLINYDYNHQNGTHRELFRIKAIEVSNYEENGYRTKLLQKVIRDENTLGELLSNPVLLTVPKTFVNRFEYSFPCLTSFVASIPAGQFMQIHSLYPETEARTKTFVIVFAKIGNPILKTLLKNSLLKAVDEVVRQDTIAIASSYPRQNPKIRLPNEEIMFYAQKLYHDW